MPRTKKKPSTVKSKSRKPIDDQDHDEGEDQDLPSDEAGRLKIKKNYEDLLGIRIEKLKGHVLNREKINKSVEGIYFICFECKRISHNLDEGLIVDTPTQIHYCQNCAKEKGIRSSAA